MNVDGVDQAWLSYARSVIDDEDHLLACTAAGGSPTHPGVDATDVRWPGYLGRTYRAGGVLCVATVHRDFASAGVSPGLRDELVRGTRRWKQRSIGDADYLEIDRQVYEVGLLNWTVGANLGAALRRLNVDLSSICYVNAARCQYPETEPKASPQESKRIKRDLVKLCVERYPIAQLATDIAASVILFTNVAAYDQTRDELPPEIAAIAIHQWLARGTAPLTRRLDLGGQHFPPKTPVAIWSPAALDHLSKRAAEV